MNTRVQKWRPFPWRDRGLEMRLRCDRLHAYTRGEVNSGSFLSSGAKLRMRRCPVQTRSADRWPGTGDPFQRQLELFSLHSPLLSMIARKEGGRSRHPPLDGRFHQRQAVSRCVHSRAKGDGQD